jgi:hypothetical protein
LRNDDSLEAGRALDLSAGRARIDGNVLSADRAQKFEFAHVPEIRVPHQI